MNEKKTWLELLEERIIDSNRVDSCDNSIEFSKYLNEIITSMFNVGKLEGRNFTYKFTEGKAIVLSAYKIRFSIIIDDFNETISIKSSKNYEREDLLTVGVIKLYDKEFILAEDRTREKFTRWHLEDLLKSTFSSIVEIQKESLV